LLRIKQDREISAEGIEALPCQKGTSTMLRPWLSLLSITLFASLALAACTTESSEDDVADGASPLEDIAQDEESTDAQDGEVVEEEDETPAETAESDDPVDDAATEPEAEGTEETADSADEQSGLSAQNGSQLVEFVDDRLITFLVPEAGEVDIEFDGTQLTLIEVRPNDGWNYDIDEEDSDEIEIEFEQQDREAELEVEIDDGMLEVEIEQEWDNAEPGTYQVGDAGEVEFDWDGERLTLIEVRPAEGWDYQIDDEESDEIEIDFRRGFDEVEFEVEVDDGQLEIEIEIDLSFEINQ
jgi:hypothetical protein